MAAAAAAATAVKKKQERAEAQRFPDDMVSAFNKYDQDGSGDIDKTELQKALGELGIRADPRTIDGILEEYVGRNVTSLGLEVFAELVNALQAKRAATPGALPHSPSGRRRTALDKIKAEVGSRERLPCQFKVRAFYTHQVSVTIVAAIIIANFIVNIVEKEIDPYNPPRHAQLWQDLDTAFNAIFLIELLVNMYGYGGPLPRFWRSGWNVFDFIIVTVGVIMMSEVDLGQFKKLKLMRAFRVFRLFKRVKSLNKIIVALMRSIPGVANAFAIMFIFFCIYAILAVELFRDFGSEGTYITLNDQRLNEGNNTVPALTDRGQTNGFEYYGTFTRALYTLFQVMTGESWSEAVARPLLFGLDPGNSVVVAIFFVSFVILTQMVMINVVVAVLLDKFVTDDDEKEDDLMDASSLLPSKDPTAMASPAPPLPEPVYTPAAQLATPPISPPKSASTDEKLDLIIAELSALRMVTNQQAAQIAELGKTFKVMA